MKKLLAVVVILILAGQAVKSQTIRNQFQLIGELAIPIDDYSAGYSAQLKWLRRLGPANQLTVSAGYGGFRASDKPADGKRTRLHLIPVLVGYRQNVINQFFVEVQAGYGEIGGRIDVGGDYARPSVGAFMWSLSACYSLPRVDIGLRYFGAHGAETIDAGTWYNLQFKYMGIYAAYNLRRP